MAKVSTVWPVNELGEVVATSGTGSTNVVGFVSQDLLPIADDGKIPIAGLSASSGNTIILDTIADLRAANTAVVKKAIVSGYYSAGDAAGGRMYVFYASPNPPADNGGTIITVSGGYYQAVYSHEVPFSWFGVKGDFTGTIANASNYTDDTAAILNALTWAKAKGAKLVGTPGMFCRTTATLPLYMGMRIDFNGMTIRPDTNVFTTGYAVTLSGASTTENARKIPLRGLRIHGPQWNAFGGGWAYSNASNLDGLGILGGGSYVEDLTLDMLEVMGFRNNVRFTGQNNYIHKLIAPKLGGGWKSNISFEVGSNSGENIVIIGGSIFNAVNNTDSGAGDQYKGTGLQILASGGSTNVDVHMFGVSVDYNDRGFYLEGGRCYLYGCHLEDNTLNPTATLVFTPANEWPGFYMYGGTLMGGPNGGGANADSGSGRQSGYVCMQGTGGHFRVAIRDTRVQIKSSSFLVYVSDKILGEMDLHPSCSGYSANNPFKMHNCGSLIFNSTFDQFTAGSPPLIPGWTLSGSTLGADQPKYGAALPAGVSAATGTWSQDATVKLNSYNSLKVVAASACNDQLVQTVAHARQNVVFHSHFYLQVSAYTSGSITARMAFFANDGSLISTKDYVTLSATTGVLPMYGAPMICPAGTVRAQFQLVLTNFVGTANINAVDVWQTSM